MAIKDSAGVERLNRIYAQYVKPLESEHWNEYALVTPDGQVYFASREPEIDELADRVPSEQNCFFKVGKIAMYNLL